MRYLIGDTVFEVVCNLRNVDMPIYREFEILDAENFRNIDISVEICNIDVSEMNFGDQSHIHTTYIWKEYRDWYVMIFSGRGKFLDESPLEDIWYLVGGKTFQKWSLFIRNLDILSEQKLKYELENRPWLQRLYIYSCMNTHTAVVHGALCNINGDGCLFLGDSGMGKSTLCTIVEPYYQVYSDDRVIVKIFHDRIEAYGTPWNIKNKKYCKNKSVDVKRVYFIYHGDNQVAYSNSNYESLKMIMSQLLHSSIFEEEDVLQWKIWISKEIMKHSKLIKFGFKPDDSCIRYICDDV